MNNLTALLGVLLVPFATSCLFVGAEPPDPCVEYCETMEKDCSEKFTEDFDDDLDTCLETCGDYENDPDIPDDGARAPNDDTLECRLYHLSLASDRPEPNNVHCGHAGSGGAGTCVNPCFEYCDIMIDGICGNSEPTFAREEDCAEECNALPLGEPDADMGRSANCLLTRARLAATKKMSDLCEEAHPDSSSACQ